MANWAWTALLGVVLIVDWSFGSWLIRFRPVSSPPPRWRRARQVELTLAFIFAGVAIAQFVVQHL